MINNSIYKIDNYTCISSQKRRLVECNFANVRTLQKTKFYNIQEYSRMFSEQIGESFFSLYTTCFVDSQSFEDTCRKPELPARVIPALKKYASKTK